MALQMERFKLKTKHNKIGIMYLSSGMDMATENFRFTARTPSRSRHPVGSDFSRIS